MSDTADVLVKVARALQRGTLPGELCVEMLPGYVRLSVARPLYVSRQRQGEAVVAAWLRRNYGAPTHERVLHRGVRRVDSYRSRRRQFVVVDVHHTVWEAGIVLETHEAHEHSEYRGKVLSDGKPVWLCTSCQKPITATAARALGLLPERPRVREATT